MPSAINSIAGSSLMKNRYGLLEIRTPDGTLAYSGKPDADAIAEAFADEHPQIQTELMNWLRRADIFGSGWHFVGVNSKQLAPLVKPGGGGLRV